MKSIFIVFFILIIVAGCQSTPESHFSQRPISVDISELNNYWVQENKSFSFDSSEFSHPGESGLVIVKYLINSDGQTSDIEIVESKPAGGWDKYAVRAVETISYSPAKENSSRTPVYVTSEFQFH